MTQVLKMLPLALALCCTPVLAQTETAPADETLPEGLDGGPDSRISGTPLAMQAVSLGAAGAAAALAIKAAGSEDDGGSGTGGTGTTGTSGTN